MSLLFVQTAHVQFVRNLVFSAFRPSGRPSAGRRADFEAFPTRTRPKSGISGPEARLHFQFVRHLVFQPKSCRNPARNPAETRPGSSISGPEALFHFHFVSNLACFSLLLAGILLVRPTSGGRDRQGGALKALPLQDSRPHKITELAALKAKIKIKNKVPPGSGPELAQTH
jgi:hypothetical protein